MTPDEIREQLAAGTAIVWAVGCEPSIELFPFTTYRALLPEEVGAALRCLRDAIGRRQQTLIERGQKQWLASRWAPLVVVWISAEVAHDHPDQVERIAKTGPIAGFVVVSGEALTAPLRDCAVIW